METNNTTKKNEVRNIPLMDDTKYFTDRLEDQINYYESKAGKSKQKYMYYKRLEFALAASIPVVIGLSTMGVAEGTILFNLHSEVGGPHNIHFTLSMLLQVFAALAGVVLAFINKIIELDEYYKSWKESRLTHELLYHQKILYLTKSEPYHQDDAFRIFVKTIEGILNQEVQKWSVIKQEDNKMTKDAMSTVNDMFKKMSDKNSDIFTVSHTETKVEETKVEEKKETKPEEKKETKAEDKKLPEVKTAEVKTEQKTEDNTKKAEILSATDTEQQYLDALKNQTNQTEEHADDEESLG